MKRDVIILCGIILIIVIGGCAKEIFESDELPATPPKSIPTPRGFPDDETIKTICQQEQWPSDCEMIPFAQGKEMCRRCKELGAGSFEQTPRHEVPQIQDERTKSFEEKREILKVPEKQCDGGKIYFDYPPFDLDKITYIEPLGKMHGNHITPTDHQYYRAPEGEFVDVYTPSDGIITLIERMGPQEEKLEDWRVIIQHTCTIETIYIHINKLAPKLDNEKPSTKKLNYVSIPVKAGEVIGQYDFSMDFNVVDKDFKIEFLSPELYEGEPWKIHVQDPFVYFNEPLKSQMEAKSLRTEAPLGGKIYYDIDGKLIGTWFLEGTRYSGEQTWNYWSGHLSIVPDYIDTAHIIISFGDFNGKEAQFGVKGNAPNPAEVGVGTLVKYELVDYDYQKNNEWWDRKTLVRGLKAINRDKVDGIVLLELLDKRRLRVEIIPDKIASQVPGFTENAKIYER